MRTAIEAGEPSRRDREQAIEAALFGEEGVPVVGELDCRTGRTIGAG
jgi:hypothetical protein